MTVASNIGWKPKNIPGSNNSSTLQIVLFSCMMAGVVITAAYRASLTSELSVRWKRYPINGPEDVLKTNYKLVVTPGTVLEDHVVKAPKGSPLKRIDEAGKVEYVHNREFRDYMFAEPNKVWYGPNFGAGFSPQKRCMVI